MIEHQEFGDAKQQILDGAEQLFISRGYAAITLRDIAEQLGMHQASLYDHFPAGKEDLFVAMATRVFERHQAGIQQAIEAAGDEFVTQLRAVADWFASQPPINLLGLIHADMPALSPAQAEQLAQVAYQSLFAPLGQMFRGAETNDEIRLVNPDLLAGCFLSLMEGLHHGEHRVGAPPRQMIVNEIVTLLLDGLRPRFASHKSL